MKNLLILALSILALFTQFQLSAQDANMSLLSDLVGTWSGTAVSQMPDGKMTFDQTEDISYELAGKLLVIKGQGKIQGTDSVAFQAYGVIHWDSPSDGYKFSAYTMDGNYVLADAKIEDKTLLWSFSVPNGGKIEYSLKFNESTWIEDGKYSPDGQQWYPFFHMELEKVK